MSDSFGRIFAYTWLGPRHSLPAPPGNLTSHIRLFAAKQGVWIPLRKEKTFFSVFFFLTMSDSLDRILAYTWLGPRHSPPAPPGNLLRHAYPNLIPPQKRLKNHPRTSHIRTFAAKQGAWIPLKKKRKTVFFGLLLSSYAPVTCRKKEISLQARIGFSTNWWCSN